MQTMDESLSLHAIGDNDHDDDDDEDDKKMFAKIMVRERGYKVLASDRRLITCESLNTPTYVVMCLCAYAVQFISHQAHATSLGVGSDLLTSGKI